MAKYGSAHVGVVLVDGYDLLPSKIESLVGPKVTSILEQTDGLGDEWEEHLAVGVRRAELSQSGWWDEDTGAINEAFVAQQDVERVVCIGLNGGARGNLFTGIRGAFGGEYERLAVRNALVKANVTYQINGEVDDDVVIAIAHSEQSDDFNSPAVAESAAATTQRVAGVPAYWRPGSWRAYGLEDHGPTLHRGQRIVCGQAGRLHRHGRSDWDIQSRHGRREQVLARLG